MNDFGLPPSPLPIPTNLQAEQILIGSILADSRTYERVARLLAPERFADPIHGKIYAAVQVRVSAGQDVNAAALQADFEGTGALDEVGGTAYLGQALSVAVGFDAAQKHADSVHDAWLRRELIYICERLHALAADTLTGAFGGSVSEFGGASGVDQAGYVVARLRGLLATLEAGLA